MQRRTDMFRKAASLILALLLAGCHSADSATSSSPSSAPDQPIAETADPALTSDPAVPQKTVAPSPDNTPVPVTDSSESIDYSDEDNWCYFGTEKDAPAEAFLVNATIYYSPEGNAEITSELARKQQGFINRLKGMVSDRCTVYAPHYREKTLEDYISDKEDRYTEYAYKDVSEAFRYYLDHVHQKGTPIVLMGFSQGGEMCKLLLEEYFAPDTEEAEALREDLVCAYITGFGMEKEFYDQNPNLKPANGETDLGVIVSFDAETPEVKDSLILKEGKEYVSINPLNWKTDGTRADASENLGAVLVSAKGEIKFEQPAFCGGYLDDTPRHALKVDDLSYADYENQIPYLPVGSYHSYDVTFFYRNIQKNVKDRIDAWLAKYRDS